MGRSGRDQPRGLERALLARAPLWLLCLLLMVGIVAAVAFGAIVKGVAEHSTRYGWIGRLAYDVASTPQTLRQLVRSQNPALAPGSRARLPAGFRLNAAQPFRDPGFLLVNRYAPEDRRFVVELVRLADGKTLHRYAPPIDTLIGRGDVDSPLFDAHLHSGQRYRMQHPLLMPDGGLVFHGTETPLVRVDACGRVLWKVRGIFHHSIDPDARGDIWVGFTADRTRYPRTTDQFREDGIARVSPDGRLLYAKSLIAILAENHLSGLWAARPYTDDPFHLNDIQPVLADGPYWKRGDVLLSLRHLSLVMLYRPSTGKVLWRRQHAWFNQHDVDIVGPQTISIFDNHVRTGRPGIFPDWVEGHNQVVYADLGTGAIKTPYNDALRKRDVRTIYEGRGTPLPNGDLFVEESNYGRLLRLAPDGTIRWRYISADGQGRRYTMAWSRYLDPSRFSSAIGNAIAARCS
ncbi:MAG TPA: arylsulfotransferase family protein [Sphingomonas sp.]